MNDYQEDRRKRNSAFSVRSFLQNAGISSPSFLKQVIDGKRNLTPAAIEKLLIVIKLSKDESEYFRALVSFNQAKTSYDKQKSYQELLSLGKIAKYSIIGEDYYEYYKHWYIPVIRELICALDFKDNYTLLAKTLVPSINTKEVKQAIQILLKFNLISKTDEGLYKQNDKLLHTGSSVQSLAIRNFNHQMTLLAAESLERFPVDQRNVRGITMGISNSTYKLIENEIEAFQQRILKLIEEDDKIDKVYQLNTMLFPLSKEEKK